MPNPTSTVALASAPPAPPCPECAVALNPVGAGRHLYWTCGYCGITIRRH